MVATDSTLVSSGPAGASALGQCEVQFRQMESRLLRTDWGFSFGALRGSVQADGIWSPQDLWGFSFRTLWGSVQADRRWVTRGPMRFQLWGIVEFSAG